MSYSVKRNSCSCHPETCCCNDWAVYKDTEKHSTYFDKKTAEEVCKALNFCHTNKGTKNG